MRREIVSMLSKGTRTMNVLEQNHSKEEVERQRSAQRRSTSGRAGATPVRLEADELPEHFYRRNRLITKLGAPTMTSHNTP